MVDLDPENPVEKVPAEPQRPKEGCPRGRELQHAPKRREREKNRRHDGEGQTVRDVRKHVGAQQRGDDEKNAVDRDTENQHLQKTHSDSFTSQINIASN